MQEYGRHKLDVNIEVQKSLSPYMELFMGERVLLSDIKTRVPHCLPALETLIQDGKVIGHHVLDDPDDMLLYMPAAVNALERNIIKPAHPPITES